MITGYKCSKCKTTVYFDEFHHCEKVKNQNFSKTFIYSSYSPKSRTVKSFSALGYEEYQEALLERHDHITGKMIIEWKRREYPLNCLDISFPMALKDNIESLYFFQKTYPQKGEYLMRKKQIPSSKGIIESNFHCF